MTVDKESKLTPPNLNMSKQRGAGLNTLSLHAGQSPDRDFGARAVPIYMTSSYVFEDCDSAAALFNLEAPGHIYSRISNPTVAVLEERLAALEGGVAAVATSSGHAALFLAIATLMGSGGHIVSSRALYGGSANLYIHTLPRFGITTTLVDPIDLKAFEAAITPNTRLIYTEILGNPGLEVADIQGLAELAHRHGLPLMVDATFSSPALCRPIEWGADIVLHSATKWLGGHGLALGGILVDGGKFDWLANADKFPTLTRPDAAYHGVNFAEEYGPFAFAMRARAEGLRDFGAAISPMNAFLILQGVETLPLRMERHVQNAQKIAEWLEAQPEISWVSYPGLSSHPHHERAKQYFPKGAGSMLAFGLKGGRAAAIEFIESLTLCSHLANVGDAKSLILHPASTTHRQLSDEQLKLAGVGVDLIRLSVGIEDCNDIIADLQTGLRRVAKSLKSVEA